MFIVKILRFLNGTVKFRVRGKFIERFLNLAAHENLPIWNSVKEGENFTAYTLASKYKKIRPFVRKTHVQVKIVERHGLPFFLKRYRMRTGLLIGLVLFILSILISGMFVWDIKITGNSKIPSDEIIKIIEEQGLSRGKFKKSIDVNKIEEELCLQFHEIGWAAVNLIGTVADIQIEECDSPPDKLDDQYPCNIIASKGGQIVYMDIYDGQKVADIKSTVKKGDIIVSGITKNHNGGNMFRHARAKVLAEYGEEKIITFPLSQKAKVPVGGAVNYKYVVLGKKYFPLFLGRKKAEDNFEHIYVRPAYLFGVKLPFDLAIRQVIPAEEKEIKVTPEKAKQMAVLLLEKFEKEIASEKLIVSRKTEGKITNDAYEITAKYVFRENIGIEEKIFIEKQHNT